MSDDKHDVTDLVNKHMLAMYNELSNEGKCVECAVMDLLIATIATLIVNQDNAPKSALTVGIAFDRAEELLKDGDYGEITMGATRH